MALSHAAAESLSRLGHYQEIVADCGRDAARINRLSSVEHRLLLADSLAKVGLLDTAQAIVAPMIHSPLSSETLATCESILGWIAREQGRVDEATHRLQHSARLFKESGNLSKTALSSVHVYRMISERHAPQEVGPLLAEARALVTKAGDPHLSALLHESVARQETQTSNYDEARRHLRIATSLVASHPNAWLEQLCLINAFCIAVYDCDLRSAEDYLLRAEAQIRVTGAFGDVIRSNQGHLYLYLGKFAKAEGTLRLVSAGMGLVPQSALEGLARLQLACGRLDECESTLNQLERLQPSISSASFPYRSSLVTRARLLFKMRRWNEASEVADKALAEGVKAQDRSLTASGHFLKAHAAVALDRPEVAAASIIAANQLSAWGIKEYQGIFMALSADLFRRAEQLGVARRKSARARRIWHEHDNVYSQVEYAEDSADGVNASAIELSSDEKPVAMMSSIASAVDLAYSPQLLGAELIDLISILGCSPDQRLVELRPAESDGVGDGKYLQLKLGAQRGRRFVLSCRIPNDPVQAKQLGDAFRFGASVVTLAQLQERERNRAALWPDVAQAQGDALFIAEELQSILATARKVASTNVPVLITGETGTGKEILARTIHAYSNRAKAAFLPFNCSSTPKDMLDSQLFGHRRGAFTGATDNFTGIIRAAAGGTLFLDEIGDMGLEVQPKLLRFLESGEVHPVGEATPTRVDVRVIAATNAPLDRLVGEGAFREDLFYRLNIVRLHLPPLRERRVEIPALAAHYLAKYAAEYSKGALRFAEETMEYLVLYRWPGNVRQLANEMRRMAALAEPGAIMMPEHLATELAASRRTIPASERILEPTEVVVRLDQPMAAGVQHLERAMTQYALKKCGGRMEETAAMLGLSRKGLYLKRQRFGIEPPTAAGNGGPSS